MTFYLKHLWLRCLLRLTSKTYFSYTIEVSFVDKTSHLMQVTNKIT
jgi:hypothetical protein